MTGDGKHSIAPIKMAMECGLFVALGFPHYFCGKIEFVWIIHHHSTDVVLSYSSRKSTRIMNIHGFLCIYIYIYIGIWIYIYTVISTGFFTGFQDLKRVFVIICHSNNKDVLSRSGKTMEHMEFFFQFTETLVKTGWIALRMEILWPCKTVGHV